MELMNLFGACLNTGRCIIHENPPESLINKHDVAIMSIHVPGETSTLLSRIPTGRVLERHTENGGLVRDAIIGLADGLTVPFAVTAGLSSYALPYG